MKAVSTAECTAIAASDMPDVRSSEEWLERIFHPFRLRCPRCNASVNVARPFRIARRTRLVDYRCKMCDSVYNLYTGTVLGNKHLRPQQAVILLQGIFRGDSISSIAAEVGVCCRTAKRLQEEIQQAGYHISHRV